MAKCFLTGSESNLIKIEVDGEEYWVDEEKHSDLPLKGIKEKIRKKKSEAADIKSKLAQAVEEQAKALGVSKEELIKLLGGGHMAEPSEPNHPVRQAEVVEKPKSADKSKAVVIDSGFVKVSGDLPAEAKVAVKAEDGVGMALPAYKTVKDNEGKITKEENKVVKVINDNTVISKSSMGQTVITIKKTDASDFNKRSQTTKDYELVNHRNRSRTCPACKGNCFINDQVCPKCQGSGSIIV